MISFDIFDTAITRKVYKPTDIFKLVENIVGNDFFNKRVEAENKAREKYTVYNIEQIYSFIPEFDKQTEIDLEIENCLPNKKFLDIYNDNVIFISDMYLGSDILKIMLEKCGYKNPKIYVSCEWGAHKGDGSLFKVINQQIECHYGDNYIADILGAKISNIPAILHVSYDNLKTTIPELKCSKLKKFLLANEYSEKSLNNKVACYFSPLVYSFTKWVLDNRENGQRIFFNARDGYLPYIIAKDIFKAENIFYIHASRKSVLSSSINFAKPIDAIENYAQFERLILTRAKNPIEFLKSINCNIDLSEFKMKNIVRDFVIVNQKKLYQFFEQKKQNAKKYLNRFDIKENDIFVDIGYYGTIQYSLEKILSVKLKGYYLQCFENNEINLQRYSYFDKKVVNACLMVESLFSSAEDGIFDYDPCGNPKFYSDSEAKKEFSHCIIKEIIESVKYLHENDIDCCYQDIEKLAIRFLYYPTLEESNYCNKQIFENGCINEYESCVGYDKDKIKSGKLQECYNNSYWRVAFIKQLQNDAELSYLEKFLTKRDY